jgi:hypothetical protein
MGIHLNLNPFTRLLCIHYDNTPNSLFDSLPNYFISAPHSIQLRHLSPFLLIPCLCTFSSSLAHLSSSYSSHYLFSLTQMAHVHHSRHAHGGFSCKPRGCSGSRLEAVVEGSSESYLTHTPPHIQEEIGLEEDDAQILRLFASYDEVLDSVSLWILDTDNTRSRVSQYLKIVEIY